MKIRLTIILLTLVHFGSFSQETYSSRKGSKFFPGHLDILITLDSKSVRYELYNHWYSWSYAECRQLIIPLDSIDYFNQNDSIKIKLDNGQIKLVDRKYRLNRKIRHKNLCASAQYMSNISYAYKLSKEHKDINPFALYDLEDLKLDEKEFKKKVIEKLNEMLK